MDAGDVEEAESGVYDWWLVALMVVGAFTPLGLPQWAAYYLSWPLFKVLGKPDLFRPAFFNGNSVASVVLGFFGVHLW